MKNYLQRLKEKFNKADKTAYYFAHIPKTAGTSFIVLLDRLFTERRIFPQQLWREVGQIELDTNNQYQLFRGHFGGGGVKVLTHNNLRNLTLLRNPIDLSVSTFRFIKREKNTKVHHLTATQDFDDFLNNPQTATLVSDRMVRNLSFDFEQDSEAQEVFLSAETIAHLQRLIKHSAKPLTAEQRYQRAKEFVDQCFWFGLVEQFEQSMQLFCHTFKLPPIGSSQKLNRRDQNIKLSQQQQQHLLELNPWDSKLYQYAEQQFAKRYRSMCQQLEHFRSDAAQTVKQLLEQQYRRSLPAPSLDRIDYDFSQPLIGDQWHRRELAQPEAQFFRWSGPGKHSHIDFQLIPQRYQLSIRIINAISEQDLDQLKLKLNNHPLEWHSDDNGVVRVLRATIEPAMIAENGLLRLQFELNNSRSHRQAFGSDDERRVGIAVHWIRIRV